MNKNICITGLLNKYSADIAYQFSQSIKVFFADFIKCLEFDLDDIDSMIKKCGQDYYNKKLVGKLKEISEYKDIVVYVRYHMLNMDCCKELIKNNFITIFLKVDEDFYEKHLGEEGKSDVEKLIEKNNWQPRNKIYSQKCDITIDCKGLSNEEVVEQIKTSLIEYYEKSVIN